MKRLWNRAPNKALQYENQLIGIIEAHEKQLYRIARLYVKNEQEALEIVYTAVYRAYKAQKQLKKTQDYKSWILKILVEAALDYTSQHRGSEVPIGMINERLGYRYQNKDDEMILLEETITTLNDKQRSVLYLKYFEELESTMVAKILGMSVEAVKATLYKALVNIDMELEEVRSNE
jgi:RNA polymerase sigma-70 factor (ECF subfamily)